MTSIDRKILEKDGWEVICEHPLEIEHPEPNSSATNYGAELVLAILKLEKRKRR